MVAPFAIGGQVFRAGKPRPWSEARYQTRGPNRMFDLHPDGTRFALAAVEDAQDGPKQSHVTIITNFSDELSRVAPTAKR